MDGGQVSCWTKRGDKRAGMCSRATLYVCSELARVLHSIILAVFYPEPNDVLNFI